MRTAGHPILGPNRHGVSVAIAALALAVLVVGAAGVVYFSGALGGASSKTTTCASVSTFSAGGVETTFTIPCVGSESNAGGGGGGEQSTTSTASTSTSRTSSTQSTSSSGISYYTGYSDWYELKDEGNTVENISAEANFDFAFNFSNDTGHGRGSGIIYDTYAGYCVGSSETKYNFTVYAGLDKNSGNFTLGWGVPDPAGGSTQITCNGQTSNAAFGFGYPVAPVFLSIKVPILGGELSFLNGNEGDVVYHDACSETTPVTS